MLRLSYKNWREFFRLETNPVIRALTVSDIFILSGFGLVSPIFAVFLTDHIQGGNVELAGMAAMIYLLTKSLGQIPVAQIIDKTRGEKDDFFFMVIGSLMISFVPLLYLIAQKPWHIYIIQFFYGFSQALTFPAWMAIFTRHIGYQKEGLEWGIFYTLTDLFGAGAAAIGGLAAYRLGFAPLFISVSILSFIGSGWLFLIHKEIKK